MLILFHCFVRSSGRTSGIDGYFRGIDFPIVDDQDTNIGTWTMVLSISGISMRIWHGTHLKRIGSPGSVWQEFDASSQPRMPGCVTVEQPGFFSSIVEDLSNNSRVAQFYRFEKERHATLFRNWEILKQRWSAAMFPQHE